MNTNDIMQKAFQKYNQIQENNSYKQDLTKSIDGLSKSLLALLKRSKSNNNNHLKFHISQLLHRLKWEKRELSYYQNKAYDNEYIVICPWSENDLYDSNADLVSNKNMASWRTTGLKVYGKLSKDNSGYIANFNYPINIVKNPNIYFFNPKELKGLYQNIANHNPAISDALLDIAVHSTKRVSWFKKRFGLDAKSLKAKIDKIKHDEANSIPNPSITKLQDYYRWELKQRRQYEGGDLSEYGDVESSPSDFNSTVNTETYNIYGHDDDDFFSDNSDITSDNFNASDVENGMNWDGYTPSDIAAGIEYDNTNIDNSDE